MKKYIVAIAAAFSFAISLPVRAKGRFDNVTHGQALAAALATAAAGDVAVRGKKSVLGRGFNWLKNGSEKGRWNDIKAAPKKIGRHIWSHKKKYVVLAAWLLWMLKNREGLKLWAGTKVKDTNSLAVNFAPIIAPFRQVKGVVNGWWKGPDAVSQSTSPRGPRRSADGPPRSNRASVAAMAAGSSTSPQPAQPQRPWFDITPAGPFLVTAEDLKLGHSLVAPQPRSRHDTGPLEANIRFSTWTDLMTAVDKKILSAGHIIEVDDQLPGTLYQLTSDGSDVIKVASAPQPAP